MLSEFREAFEKDYWPKRRTACHLYFISGVALTTAAKAFIEESFIMFGVLLLVCIMFWQAGLRLVNREIQIEEEEIRKMEEKDGTRKSVGKDETAG